MRARVYFGNRLLGEVDVSPVPRMLQRKGEPASTELPAVGDTVTLALIDEARRPLFLTGKLERA